MKARIKFRKYGSLRFIGHLDVMRFFQKVMRRSGIPIAFTEGYSPHMIMSFASPLAIGLCGDGEYFDIELTEPINGKEAVRRMNQACPEGIEVLSFRQIADEKKMTGMTILSAADYYVIPKEESGVPEDWRERFTEFLGQDSIVVVKQTKRSEREADLRPLIYECRKEGEGIVLCLAAGSRENLKPDLVMDAFCGYAGYSCGVQAFSFRRLEMYADMGENNDRKLVTLEELGTEMG